MSKKYTKEQKIVYFLWLDDQIMMYWAQYVELKFQYGEEIEPPEHINIRLSDLLSTIDHFEAHQDVLKKDISYAEVDKFVRANPQLCKKYLYFAFLP
tara:strand:+ start:578 stop:868 length:291 start_codon:yes stop_codon:yes gene_type:complete